MAVFTAITFQNHTYLSEHLVKWYMIFRNPFNIPIVFQRDTMKSGLSFTLAPL